MKTEDPKPLPMFREDRLEPRAETICLEKERAFREYELIYEGLK